MQIVLLNLKEMGGLIFACGHVNGLNCGHLLGIITIQEVLIFHILLRLVDEFGVEATRGVVIFNSNTSNFLFAPIIKELGVHLIILNHQHGVTTWEGVQKVGDITSDEIWWELWDLVPSTTADRWCTDMCWVCELWCGCCICECCWWYLS